MLKSYYVRTTKSTFKKHKKCKYCDSMISSGMSDHIKTDKCKKLRLRKYINLF